MSYAIRALGYARPVSCPVAGQFLKFYDPNAKEASGLYEFTHRLHEAKVFPTAYHAMQEWKRVREVDPHGGRIEPDGKLNRPLTAFTIELVKIPGSNEYLNPGDL